MTPVERFRAEFQRRRHLIRLSQPAACERLREYGIDWHPTTLSKIENGDRGVGLSEAVALAGILGTTLSELLDGSPESAREAERTEFKLRLELEQLRAENQQLRMWLEVGARQLGQLSETFTAHAQPGGAS